jgi:hypothetical protein
MSDETKEKGDGGAAFLLLLAVAPSAMWSGFVAVKIWAWFIVPQFGLRPLTIPIAIGLALFVSFWFKKWNTDSEPTTWESAGKYISNAAVYPAAFLLYGWIVQHWVTP